MYHDPHPQEAHTPINPRTCITPYSSARTRADWATAIFIIFGLITLLSLATTIHQISLIKDLLNGQQVSNLQLQASDAVLSYIGYIYSPTFITAAITFLLWLRRASTNLEPLGNTYQEYSPFRAIFWWFIPAASLIHPYWVVKEIWHQSRPDPSQRPVSVLLGPWWLTWITSILTGTIGSAFLSKSDPSLADLQTQHTIAAVSDVTTLISLVFVIIILRKITSNQDLKHMLLTAQR